MDEEHTAVAAGGTPGTGLTYAVPFGLLGMVWGILAGIRRWE